MHPNHKICKEIQQSVFQTQRNKFRLNKINEKAIELKKMELNSLLQVRKLFIITYYRFDINIICTIYSIYIISIIYHVYRLKVISYKCLKCRLTF